MAVPHRTSHQAFDAAALAAAKGDHTVAVCLPARDEAATVGAIVETLRTELVEAVPLIDELVVIDDHSTDDTARIARDAGAEVVDARTTVPEIGGPGKGQALWKSLHATTADLVVWCDADIEEFGSHFVIGLTGPLLTNAEISFVKGSYRRPATGDTGGGRVTELLARPALATLFPELGVISQPLSGEYGGRRRLLERLPFVDGYGVDVALLIDVVRTVGLDGVAEVDLGRRRHRHRPLTELGPQATSVLRAVLRRAGMEAAEHPIVLRRPELEPLLLSDHEIPPLVEHTGYRRRTA